MPPKPILSRCENRGIAKPTLNKYKTFIKQFRAFCEAKGYVMLDQLTVADMDILLRFVEGQQTGARKKARTPEIIRQLLPEARMDGARHCRGSSRTRRQLHSG